MRFLLLALVAMGSHPTLASVNEFATDRGYFDGIRVDPKGSVLKLSYGRESAHELPFYKSADATKPEGVCHLKEMFAAIDQLHTGKSVRLDCGPRLLSLSSYAGDYELFFPLLEETAAAYKLRLGPRSADGLWVKKSPVVAPANVATPYFLQRPATTSSGPLPPELEKLSLRQWLLFSGTFDLTTAAAKKGLSLSSKAGSPGGPQSACFSLEDGGNAPEGSGDWLQFECVQGGCESARACACPEVALDVSACTPSKSCATGWGRWRDEQGQLLVYPADYNDRCD